MFFVLLGGKTYSESSKTLDVWLNLQQARQKSTKTMIHEDKNCNTQVQNIKKSFFGIII